MINPDEMSEEAVHQFCAAWRGSLNRQISAMLLVETVLVVGIEEFRESMADEDIGLCVLCSGDSAFHDRLHIPWCAEHQFRGVFIDLMLARRWPALDVYDPDLIREGAWIENGRFTRKEIPFSSLTGTPQSSVWVALTSSDEDIVSLGIAALEQENAA